MNEASSEYLKISPTGAIVIEELRQGDLIISITRDSVSYGVGRDGLLTEEVCGFGIRRDGENVEMWGEPEFGSREECRRMARQIARSIIDEYVENTKK